MKRCRFAALLLLALLAAGLWVTDYMDGIHSPLAEAVGQAGDASLPGNWEEALQALGRARELWEDQRRAVAAFADHEPMEEIDALFAQLEVAAQVRDGPGFASLCAHLKEALKAMGEAHSPSWWNVL